MEQNVTINLTLAELDLLLHFATIGQNHIHVRNNYGDQDVAAQLDAVLKTITYQLLDSVED